MLMNDRLIGTCFLIVGFVLLVGAGTAVFHANPQFLDAVCSPCRLGMTAVNLFGKETAVRLIALMFVPLALAFIYYGFKARRNSRN